MISNKISNNQKNEDQIWYIKNFNKKINDKGKTNNNYKKEDQS
jgi:hypothetical protein